MEPQEFRKFMMVFDAGYKTRTDKFELYAYRKEVVDLLAKEGVSSLIHSMQNFLEGSADVLTELPIHAIAKAAGVSVGAIRLLQLELSPVESPDHRHLDEKELLDSL